MILALRAYIFCSATGCSEKFDTIIKLNAGLRGSLLTFLEVESYPAGWRSWENRSSSGIVCPQHAAETDLVAGNADSTEDAAVRFSLLELHGDR